MDDNFVKIMKCRFCGKKTNALALHRQLRPIKGDVYDTEPCDECKELFKTHKYFIGDCGHNGFIKTKALEKIVTPSEFEKLKSSKIFRMVKCFACMKFVKLEECPTI